MTDREFYTAAGLALLALALALVTINIIESIFGIII